jgi:cellulose synthase/poly-beta-1,6-N-acetylglucosamine synthase-like glycosyltransferase
MKMFSYSIRRDLKNFYRLVITIGAPCLFAPALIVGTILALSLIFPNLVIDSTLLTIYFFVTCALYSVFLLVVISRAKPKKGEDVGHFFSLLVPAHNEERVLNETLETLLCLDYPSELFEVIVINDGSSDQTERIAMRLQKKYSNLKVFNIPNSKGGKGKGMALNVGFADFLLTWRGLEIKQICSKKFRFNLMI